MLDKCFEECPNCKESFPCSTTLKVHSQEHVLPNVKQFISDKSNRIGGSSNGIENSKHSKITTNQLLLISYDCYICDGSYSTRELLVQHSHSHLLGHSCTSPQCQQLYGVGIMEKNSMTNNSTSTISNDTSHTTSYKNNNVKSLDHQLQNSSKSKSNPYQNDNEGKSDNKKRGKSEPTRDTTTNVTNKYSNFQDSTIQVSKNPLIRKVSTSTKSKSALNSSSPGKLKRSYQCKTCQKILSSKISHIEHTRLHTNEKPYKCQICTKSYAVKNTFRQHMAIHSSASCKKSGESMSYPNGNKNYKCSVCSDSFSTREKLDYHTCPTMSKRGESFRCKICGKTFARKEWRTRHYLTSHNNGESCFRCEICGEIFPDEQFYLIHAQDHFSREIKKAFLNCNVCGRTFPGKELYERHSCRCAAVVSSC